MGWHEEGRQAGCASQACSTYFSPASWIRWPCVTSHPPTCAACLPCHGCRPSVHVGWDLMCSYLSPSNLRRIQTWWLGHHLSSLFMAKTVGADGGVIYSRLAGFNATRRHGINRATLCLPPPAPLLASSKRTVWRKDETAANSSRISLEDLPTTVKHSPHGRPRLGTRYRAYTAPTPPPLPRQLHPSSCASAWRWARTYAVRRRFSA